MPDREPTDPGALVTQGQCSANVRMVLDQGRRQDKSLEHITGKLDTVLVAQEAQGKQLHEVQTAQVAHEAKHQGVENGVAKVTRDQASRRTAQVLSLRVVMALVFIGTLLVGGTLWVAARTMQIDVDELAATLDARRGPAPPAGGTSP